MSADLAKNEFTHPTVYIVDDDEGVRSALTELVTSIGIAVKSYDNVHSFLNEYLPSLPGCLVLDVRLPGISGLELQDHLKRKSVHIPIIFVTGHSNVTIAVRSMKAGAIDFLEKPFDDQLLLDSIQKALEIDRISRSEEQHRTNIMHRIKCLSPREDEVLKLLIKGKSNKSIADEMSLSTKTIETHRAHIMRKLGVKSMAGLMWMAIKSGVYHEIPDHLPFDPPRRSQTVYSML